MPTLRSLGGVRLMSLPSMEMVPDVGSSKPAIMRRVVVLPQPLGPRNETNSPRADLQVEALDRHVAGELLAHRRQLQERHRAAYLTATTLTRPRDLRPMTAIMTIASQVSPKLMSDTAAGSYVLDRPSTDR